MKKLLLTGIIVSSIAGMLFAEKVETTLFGHISKTLEVLSTCNWTKTTHDFGKVTQGTPVSFMYEFTNSGKEPIVISSVSPGCGCTTQNYSKEPVAPGKKGFVTLTYNAAALGTFTKAAHVVSNAGDFTLNFTGEVITK